MNNHRNKFSRFLLGKGMYVALAVCLAGAGTAAWITLNSMNRSDPFAEAPQTELTQPQEETNSSLSAQEPQTTPSQSEAAPVEQKQPDITKPESKPTDDSSASSSSGSSSGDTTASAGLSEPLVQSDKSLTLSFTLPLNTQVMAPFSGDQLVKNITLKEWRTHNGVDLKAEKGDMVKSACDGRVSAITFDPLWGTTVEIQSGDYVLTYCGLSQDLNVKLNDSIAMGEHIGSVDVIPCEAADGIHLHFMVENNDEYIDPLSLLSE